MDIDKEKNPLVEKFEEEGSGSIEKREDTAEEQELKEVQPEIKGEDIVYTKPVPSDGDNEASILKETDNLREKTEGRKIEHLLELAQDKGKGIDFAIEVAKKTGDPCLIDLLHDTLVKKGLYL
ncbi:MAG: hypothetical protein Q7R99_03230 [bacterium]|nr:hypothetical protein [bacterium]